MTDYYDRETFEHKGHVFELRVRRDEDMGPPWEEHDGHGIVSEWTQRDKKPGEKVLCTDHRSHRFYDVQATMELARKDGWGLGDKAKIDLTKHLGHAPSKREILVEAVEQDYNWLYRWCNDQWCWIFIAVTMDDAPDDVEYLSGIESEGDHYKECAHELAEQILQRFNKEAEERRFWAERDVVTR